jgi:hypothetical protein
MNGLCTNYDRVSSAGDLSIGRQYEVQQTIDKHVYSYLFGSRLAQAGLQTDFSERADTTNSSFFLWAGSDDLQLLLDDPKCAATIMMGLMATAMLQWPLPEAMLPPLKRTEVKLKGVATTAETLGFCARNKIVSCLEQAIELVRTCFSPDRTMRVFLQNDPEDGDEYAVLEVDPSGDSDADLNSFLMYADEWSGMVDWPASRMILLDLRATARR